MPERRRPRRRPTALLLGLVMLAGLGAAGHVAATERPDANRANFRLVGPRGETYSLGSFAPDSVLVIYFGYTTCLRACPTALDSIAAAVDDLGPTSRSVHPVFIAMDPEAVALMSMPLFTRSFGPSLLGLTGSPQAIAAATEAFAVDVERIQFSADPSDYAMTHTSAIFVMRPGDALPLPLPATSSPEAIAVAVRAALRRAA